MFVKAVAAKATFSPERMTKTTLAQGGTLFAGLNCFEPGQEHALHSHAGQDKLYFILEGTGLVQIGGDEQELQQGDLAFAPADVPHAIRNTGTSRLVVMAMLAPPPAGK